MITQPLVRLDPGLPSLDLKLLLLREDAPPGPRTGVGVEGCHCFPAVDDWPLSLQRIVRLSHLMITQPLGRLDPGLPSLDLKLLLLREDAPPVENLLEECVDLGPSPQRVPLLEKCGEAILDEVHPQACETFANVRRAEDATFHGFDFA